MKRITFLAGMLCVAMIGQAEVSGADDGMMYRDARSMSMGDTKVAGGRGGTDFVSNPALLGNVSRFSISVPNIPLYINSDLRDIAKFVKKNKGNFENFDNLSTAEKEAFIKDIEPYDGKWARLNVSPMVSAAASFLGTGVGVAVYNISDTGFKIDRGIYEPRVWGEGTTSTVFAVGVARPLLILYPGLKVGANFKYIDRRTAPIFQIKASDLGNAQDTMDPIVDSANDNSSTHFAMDFGALLEVPFIESEVGASLRNIGYGEYASVDLGIAKRFFNNRLAVLADYVDFFDNRKENVFRKIHVGGEYDLGVLELRAGMNAGYPTIGAGIDLKVVRIDAAYFTDELSNVPGGDEDERFALQMRLGW